MRVLSGKDVIAILSSFGFSVVGQKGSHVKLRREINGTRQSLTVPNHTELDRGTAKAIFNQAMRYIPEDELRKQFYE